MSESVLDRLVVVLSDALGYNAGAVEAPVALLWPDEARQWEPVMEPGACPCLLVCVRTKGIRGRHLWV